MSARDAYTVRAEMRAMMEEDAPLIELRQASGIACQPIRWLWRGYLARGKLHILAGAPGTGKTTIALALAAVLTRGNAWPDGTVAPVGNVLVWSGEDDPADTLVPRLKAAGADLTRVFIVGDVADAGEKRAFDPATDITVLELEAARIGDVALLIADPVVNAVAGDSHKNTEVRRALQPLVNLGQRLGCAVLGISHFSKGSAGREPLERVTGSLAFGALARIVLVTAKGEDGSRLLARAKSNICQDGGGFAYALEQYGAEGLDASRVIWGAVLDGSARALLGEAEADPNGERSETDEAEDFLRDLLTSGPMGAGDIQKLARKAFIADRALRRARERLGVKTTKQGGHFGDGRQRWVWRLPAEGAEGAEDAQQIYGAPSASSGHLQPCPACDGEGCRHCRGGAQ